MRRFTKKSVCRLIFYKYRSILFTLQEGLRCGTFDPHIAEFFVQIMDD